MSDRPGDLPFDAPAVERGIGLFETILLVGQRASLVDEHIARLIASTTRLDLPAPRESQLRTAANDIVARASPTAELALRLTWLAVGHSLDDPSAWRLDASTRPIPAVTLRRRAGCAAVTLPMDFARDTPSVKSTSYLAGALGLRYAERRGANEGLLVASDGTYLEGTATALLAWDNGHLVTSPHGVLPSVTAAAFIRQTAAHELRPASRPLTRNDLRAGAIIVGALTRSAPLVSLDGESCEQPVAMLAQIAAFNRWLATH